MDFSLEQSGAKMRGETYVYYNRLLEDGFTALHAKASSVFEPRINEGSNFENIAIFFDNLRKIELAKELKLLREVYGDSITEADVLNDESGKKLIFAFNECLNIRKAFERNLLLIQESEGGQKGIYTWFPTYFKNAVDFYHDAIEKDIAERTVNLPKEEIPENAAAVVRDWIPELTRYALDYMINKADQEQGIHSRKDLADAYKELSPLINSTMAAKDNPFIKSFIKLYKLDDIANMIEEQQKGKIDWKRAMNASYEKMGKRVHSAGGESLEQFEQMIVLSTMTEKLQGKNFTTHATGRTRQKADNIYTIGIPLQPMMDWLENNKFGDPVKDTAAIAKLQQEVLNNFPDGFIIYSSAKNAVLNKGFIQRGGFSAGTPLQLGEFEQAAENLGMRVKELIGTIMQIIPGAIFDKREKDVKLILVRAIAAALFDDFATIGEETEGSTATAIHLMDLRGVYVPVSWFFDLIAKAFHNGGKGRTNFVKVTLKRPNSIEFKTMEEQRRWEADHPGKSAWAEQAKIARENTYVSYQFLRQFKRLMQNLNL